MADYRIDFRQTDAGGVHRRVRSGAHQRGFLSNKYLINTITEKYDFYNTNFV